MFLQIIKIPFNRIDVDITPNTIGIDIGYSLTKIAYINDNLLNLSLIPTENNFKTILEFLRQKKDNFNRLILTGGGGFKIYNELKDYFESTLLNEFYANSKGIEKLYLLEKKKNMPPIIIVSIGTGTSVVLKSNSFQHLGGSAMGGAFFMGMMKMLYNITDYEEAITLARNGNRYNIDLKVSDIYDIEDNRVNNIFREFTAASMGKIDKKSNINLFRKEDFINSLICLIGENLATIAYLFAENNSIKQIVFCGGFLKENKVLKRILSLICKYNNKKAIFLKNSIFAGAIGCLFNK
ncbi:MAG: hypothetical protein ACTSQG_07620 [Promethearchaeota archaeon]